MLRLTILALGPSCLTPAYGRLLFTLRTTDGSLKLNSGSTVTSSFTLEGLVTNTHLTSGIFGSDRYTVANAWFTMPSAVTFTSQTADFAGVYGSAAIPSWDRLAPIGAAPGPRRGQTPLSPPFPLGNLLNRSRRQP